MSAARSRIKVSTSINSMVKLYRNSDKEYQSLMLRLIKLDIRNSYVYLNWCLFAPAVDSWIDLDMVDESEDFEALLRLQRKLRPVLEAVNRLDKYLKRGNKFAPARDESEAA